jgi:hypothetical protein
LIGNAATGIFLLIIALILFIFGFRLSSKIERWAKGGLSQFQDYPQVFQVEDSGLPEFDPIMIESQKSQTSRVSLKPIPNQRPRWSFPWRTVKGN